MTHPDYIVMKEKCLLLKAMLGTIRMTSENQVSDMEISKKYPHSYMIAFEDGVEHTIKILQAWIDELDKGILEWHEAQNCMLATEDSSEEIERLMKEAKANNRRTKSAGTESVRDI